MDQELIILVIPIAIVYLNTEPSVLRTIETIYIYDVGVLKVLYLYTSIIFCERFAFYAQR